MTGFNWEYVYDSPIKFMGIWLVYSLYAFRLSVYRLATPFQEHPTNYVTAMKSLLLKIFFRMHYQFIYSSPPAALKAARQIEGNGWHAFEFEANQNQRLQDYDVVMLYFHGGGYAIGEPLQYAVSYKRWRRKAAQRDFHMAIVALKYPLTLEGKSYPTQRDAALAAYEYLIKQENVSSSKIVLAGDSAGGNLAASVLVYLRDHPQIARPAGTILISPWLDPSLSKTSNSPFAVTDFVYGDNKPTGTQTMAKLFAGEQFQPSSPEISLALSKDLTGVPGHLCCYGAAEVYQEDSKMWIKRCKADGVDVIEYRGKGAVHTFPLGGLTADSQLEKEADNVLLDYIVKQVGIKQALF